MEKRSMAFNGEILEILSWLPAKYIYKFSSVCTSLQGYLSDTFFAKKQSKNMLLFEDTDFFIQSHDLPWITPATRGGIRYNLPHQSLDFLSNRGRVVASSNGLLCCKDVNDLGKNLLIFNPTSRIVSKIAMPEITVWRSEAQFNVFFSCENDDYFFMALIPPEEWGEDFSFMIYSPDMNIWRYGGSFCPGARNINFKNYVYLDRVLYMISDTWGYITEDSRFYWPYIIALEPNSPDESRFLAIPEKARKGVEGSSLRIFKWGGSDSESKSICLVKLLKNVFTLWVMSGNHVSPGWRRILKKRVNDMGIQVTDGFEISGFTIWNGRFLLFATRDKVYLFDIENQWINGEAEELCGHEHGMGVVSLISFSSTLRPCGRDAVPMKDYLDEMNSVAAFHYF